MTRRCQLPDCDANVWVISSAAVGKSRGAFSLFLDKSSEWRGLLFASIVFVPYLVTKGGRVEGAKWKGILRNCIW